MIADLVVADRQLLSESHVCIHNGFIIQFAEHKPLFVVAVVHQHPHPFAGAELVVAHLNLDVITLPPSPTLE